MIYPAANSIAITQKLLDVQNLNSVFDLMMIWYKNGDDGNEKWPQRIMIHT